MRINTREVRGGFHNGKEVWICHYLQPDLNKKPLRNIPPTKCVIRDNKETSKNIYYSESHFVKVGKNGKLTKTIFSPVDNTGYRMRSGNELYVFDCKEDCAREFIKQVGEVMDRIQARIDTAANYWISERNKLRDVIAEVDNDY